MSDTPTAEQKIGQITDLMGQVLKIAGIDLTDPSLEGTPKRVAKLLINEMLATHGKEPPKVAVFDHASTPNTEEMVLITDIDFSSYCEHHLAPFWGTAYIAYFPTNKVIGLSKPARLVDHFASRLQLQERIGAQVFDELSEQIGTADIAVILQAQHTCVMCRGAKKIGSSTVTTKFGGRFNDPAIQDLLWQQIAFAKRNS